MIKFYNALAGAGTGALIALAIYRNVNDDATVGLIGAAVVLGIVCIMGSLSDTK